MQAVGAVVPVLPVSLVASVFVDTSHPLSALELKAQVYTLMQTLEDEGAHVYIPRRDQDYAITVGLRALTLRHLAPNRGTGRALPSSDGGVTRATLLCQCDFAFIAPSASGARDSGLYRSINQIISPQYVARPPDRSKTPPVENVHSSEANQLTRLATSSIWPKRPIGIFERIYSTCSGVIC